MRVLVFEGVAACPHTETSTEIAIKETLYGSVVFYFPAFLYTTHQFWRSNVNGNASLGSKNVDWWKYLTEYVLPFSQIVTLSEREIRDCYNHTRRDEFEELDLANYCRALSHSMVETPLNSETEETLKLSDAIALVTKQSCLLLRLVIDKVRPDLIYVFNGRNPEAWPCYKLFRNLGPDCVFHERGATYKQYALFDAPPAYIGPWQRAYREWNSKLLTRNDEIESALFFRRQEVGRLKNFSPYNTRYNQARYNIKNLNWESSAVFFSSSNFEIQSVPDSDVWNELGDQHSVVVTLYEVCRSLGVPLVIRLHPHSGQYDAETFESLANNIDCFVIKASDEISSYYIAKMARYRFTVGSTITWELMYRGLSCGVLANTFASGEVGITELNTVERIYQFMSETPTADSTIRLASKCGLFLSTFGYSYDFFQPEDEFRGKFNLSDLASLVRAD